MVLEGLELYRQIEECAELIALKEEGFMEGYDKGKTMDVSVGELQKSLGKQWDDFKAAYYRFTITRCKRNPKQLKKDIANLINVAGCLFLKLQELYG